MEKSKVAGLSILYFIGTFILAVVIALTTIFAYFPLQLFLFAKGDYLLFISSTFNLIPVLMIVFLIIYALIRIKEKYFTKKEKRPWKKEESDEPVDIETLGKLDKLLLKLLSKLVALDDIFVKLFKVIKIS